MNLIVHDTIPSDGQPQLGAQSGREQWHGQEQLLLRPYGNPLNKNETVTTSSATLVANTRLYKLSVAAGQINTERLDKNIFLVITRAIGSLFLFMEFLDKRTRARYRRKE